MFLKRLALACCLLLMPPAANAVTKIEQVTTASGIEIWLVREPLIPIIALEGAWRDAGSAAEPGGREGSAKLLASIMTEGAGDLDATAFQTRLEELAGSIGFSADRDEFRTSLRTLTKNKDEMFRLLALALSEPRLDSEPLQRLRQQALIRLAREQEDPNAIGSRRLLAEAFPNHPYGRHSGGTIESLPTISADDLRLHLRKLARGNLVIGMVGDVSKEEAARLVDMAFGKLAATSSAERIPAIQPKVQRDPIVITRDIPQSQIQFLGRGVKRDDPDYYAAFVMNYVLGGGGFNSRLMEEVREKRGLAYSVYTYLLPMRESAAQIGGFGTQNERARESLEVVRNELARIRDGGISDLELQNAKTYLNGSFPLQLSSNSRIAGMLVRMQLDDLPIDYLEKRQQLINSVSGEDIKRVAKRLIDPTELLIVVVGKPVGIGG